MTKLFNGTFETLLRVLLILAVKGRITIDRILEYEFMATYGREFGISEENLHGNNNFNFAEISIRRIYIRKAIGRLYLSGLIELNDNSQGFTYSLSEKGKKSAAGLKSEYATEFTVNLKNIIENFDDFDDKGLMRLINESFMIDGRNE